MSSTAHKSWICPLLSCVTLLLFCAGFLRVELKLEGLDARLEALEAKSSEEVPVLLGESRHVNDAAAARFSLPCRVMELKFFWWAVGRSCLCSVVACLRLKHFQFPNTYQADEQANLHHLSHSLPKALMS